MRDTAGNSLFLYGHMPQPGQVLSSLNKMLHRPSGSLTMTAGVDKNGKFDGSLKATLTGADGKVISQLLEPKAKLSGKEAAAIKDQVWTWNHMTMKNLTPPDMPSPRVSNTQQQKAGPEKVNEPTPIQRGR